MNKRLYIETVGCQMNVLDSEMVVANLKQHGYQLVNRPGDADVMLYNSCSVRQMAEEAYVYSLNRTYQFQYLSAKERYDSFVANYPQLMQKIPLGMIATYIGITQQSLSRIRKMR